MQRASAAKTDQKQQTDDREHYIQMDGQEVYRFATRRVPQCIEEALSDAGLVVPDIDMFVLHQANARIIDAVAKRLHADREKISYKSGEGRQSVLCLHSGAAG